jgi:hypothetical protein
MACSLEEEDISTSANLTLIFSQDTVLFDTVLSARTSITKRFRITNPNKNAVEFSSIRLGKGRGSDYSLIINGKADDDLEGEVLFGGDSLLILVEVEIDPQDEGMPYIVKDSIIVDWNGNSAHVKLVAWGQDATYLNQALIKTSTWSAGKPYVIRDFALVDSLETLTVEAGTTILLDNDASLFVAGTLIIQGDTANQVVIRNTRFDRNYLEAPGQWGGLFFVEGSKNNRIDHAIIENGSIGLRVGTPDDDDDYDLVVTNTIIRHMLSAGILAFTSDIDAYNIEIYNCGTYLVGNFAGGNYRYRHSTLTNQPSFFVNDNPMVQFSDNVVIGDDELLIGDLTVLLENNIIWGSNDLQLISSDAGGAVVDFTMTNNIIRSEEEIPDNFTSVERNFPGFLDPFVFNYQLDSVAFAIGKARASDILLDIKAQERDDMPDIGAHEYIQK